MRDPDGAIGPNLPPRWISVRRHKVMVRAGLSQTGELRSDFGVPIGLLTGPVLHGRTPPDWPDGRHETTDQKVGSFESLRARSAAAGQGLVLQRQRFPVRLGAGRRWSTGGAMGAATCWPSTRPARRSSSRPATLPIPRRRPQQAAAFLQKGGQPAQAPGPGQARPLYRLRAPPGRADDRACGQARLT
jgi:hypothetical protein